MCKLNVSTRLNPAFSFLAVVIVILDLMTFKLTFALNLIPSKEGKIEDHYFVAAKHSLFLDVQHVGRS